RVPSVTPAGGCASWAHAAFARNTSVVSRIGDLISLALWSAILLHQPAALWGRTRRRRNGGGAAVEGRQEEVVGGGDECALEIGRDRLTNAAFGHHPQARGDRGHDGVNILHAQLKPRRSSVLNSYVAQCGRRLRIPRIQST